VTVDKHLSLLALIGFGIALEKNALLIYMVRKSNGLHAGYLREGKDKIEITLSSITKKRYSLLPHTLSPRLSSLLFSHLSPSLPHS
jgi:hypothetical protein